MVNRTDSRLVDHCAKKTMDVLVSSDNREADRDYEKYLSMMNSLLQSILDAPGFGNNFSLQDLDDFLEVVGEQVSYPIDASKIDIKPSIKKYLGQKPLSFDFYFNIGEAFCFPDGYELGRTTIKSLAGLPSSVQKHISETWEEEFQWKRHPRGKLGDYIAQRRGDWYIHTTVRSIGRYRAVQKAIENAKQALGIARLFFFQTTYDPIIMQDHIGIEHSFNRWYGFARGHQEISSFGKGWHKPLARIPKQDYIIKSINSILNVTNPTDIDNAIANAIDVFSQIDDEAPLHVRFLIVMIAIESLVLGRDIQDQIASRAAERVAILVGGDRGWMKITYGTEAKDLTEDFISSHLSDSRLRLQTKFKELYSKRSGIAHEGLDTRNRGVTFDDYNHANMILRAVLDIVMQLKNKEGIRSISKQSRSEGKSLSEYVDRLKYSFEQ